MSGKLFREQNVYITRKCSGKAQHDIYLSIAEVNCDLKWIVLNILYTVQIGILLCSVGESLTPCREVELPGPPWQSSTQCWSSIKWHGFSAKTNSALRQEMIRHQAVLLQTSRAELPDIWVGGNKSRAVELKYAKYCSGSPARLASTLLSGQSLRKTCGHVSLQEWV